ncbi:stealth family protein [Sulfurovum sp. TSL1]|uniref:stealth family protein n=1 Tax=Sulfurovum sp. TSL1 TaxID=2826994 RepID=UPI001CC7756F|nr:stealth family protein [Sulfurovum sp. TSL1]GIT99333.1 glycosyl transferase [Sulfurovum sp. TSL1]
MNKIDFVLPWVDGNDPQWKMKKRKYAKSLLNKYDNDAGISRYRDTNTLKYALRSIEKYCPWYNKIHIITEGHRPDWLNVKHPKINFVTHEELYFDVYDLPTFSSESIEMNLANLKGLSEHFVYLNDDFIILSSLTKERFFKNGKPVDFLIHGWIPRNKLYQRLRDSSGFVKSVNNNIALTNKISKPKKIINQKDVFFHHTYPFLGKISNYLLLKIWGKYFFISHWHFHQPYTLSTIKKVHELFSDSMKVCSKNRFRGDKNLNQYMYRYYHLTQENFYPYYHNDGYIARIRSLKSLNNILRQLETGKYDFVAIFDDYKQEEAELIIEKLTDYFEKKFVQKACFEL